MHVTNYAVHLSHASLKQCDLKVTDGLIFSPRWDWGEKKEPGGRRNIYWNWFWVLMSDLVEDSKSSATAICTNLRLNPVMPPAAVLRKYFVYFINKWNFPTEICLDVEAQHSVVGSSTSSTQIPISASSAQRDLLFVNWVENAYFSMPRLRK